MSDKLMTLQKAAEYLNVHRGTLYRLAQKREIPVVKIGRIWRFRKEKIDAWLDSKEQKKRKSNVD